MLRVVFYLFIFIDVTFALDIVPKKVSIYKEIEFTKDFRTFDEILKDKESLKKIKHFRRLLIRSKSNDNTWLKISLENRTNKNLKRVFVTKWARVHLDLYGIAQNRIVFQDKIRNDNYLKKSSAITIPSNSQVDLYIFVKTNKAIDQFAYMYMLDENIVESFIILKEKLHNYGLFFGILFVMAMYSFFMYFSIKEKGYLYLGFYQSWILVATSDIWQYFFILLEKYPSLSYLLLKGLFTYSMVFFSILFTKEFFNTKKELPILNKVLNTLLFLLVPLSLMQIRVDYGSFLYIVYVFVGFYVFIKKRDLSALFFTLGFLGFALFSVGLNLSRLFEWDFYFGYVYAKQIFTSIESFALTMALYLKIKSIVRAKEKAEKEIIEKEKMMLVQSRFASMGEMLASIAHQWRQPLNHLDMILGNILLAYETKKLNYDYLKKKSLEGHKQLEYMSETIEDFSSFFSSKGKIEKFYAKELIDYVIDLIKSRTNKYQVDISVDIQKDLKYTNYKSELTQVLIIVLNNAIDALMLNNPEDRKIKITVKANSITIEDNAGGIPEHILPKIFDPYFSTKDKKFGTGLGLYTAKVIMENLIKGKIKALNIDNGVLFSITIP